MGVAVRLYKLSLYELLCQRKMCVSVNFIYLFLTVLKNQFVRFGGVLRDNEKVTDIVPGEIIHVKTNKALYKTRKLILTPGINSEAR